MRVLWLRPSKGDNISVRRERIAAHLRERGVEVDIQNVSGTDAFAALKRAATGDYDVIAGNVRVGLYLGYPTTCLLGIPFLGDVSDPLSDIDYLPQPLFRFLCWYEWQVLKRADAAVFVYESSYLEAKRRGIDAVKLPNAVDYERFAEPDEEAVGEVQTILEREGVRLNRPVAIYIGGFTQNYHIVDILEATHLSPEWEFVFVGEGPQEREIRETARNLENVHFPGAFSYELMPGFLAHADVGFCFKDAEQPLKLKEYGAAGLATIVQPGELERWYPSNALVVTEPTSGRIVDALNRLVADRNQLDEYGENLQRQVEQYSWYTIADEYHRMFQRLTDTNA